MNVKLEWLSASIMIVMSGCTGADRATLLPASVTGQEPTGNGKTNGIAAKHVPAIRAGVGIDDCHIGMAVSDLGPTWEPTDSAIGSISPYVYMHNKSMGIGINSADGRVITVFFYYLSRDVEPYRGRTERGVSATSTLEDIRTKHGEPSYIYTITESEFGEFPGKHEVCVVYAENGITFTMIDDKVADIRVYARQLNVDYRNLEKLYGDSLIYTRPPEKRKKPEHGSPD